MADQASTDLQRADEGDSTVAAFAGYLALVYHEARNVRHLIGKGHIQGAAWERLRSLPTNREDAWLAIQPVRKEAAAAPSASKAAEAFVKRFAADLTQLIALYDNPHWKSSCLGGNAWGTITRAVRDLRDALDARDRQRSTELLASLPAMWHNTGRVSEKLTGLDQLLVHRL